MSFRYKRAVAITKSDDDTFAPIKALYVGTGGNIRVLTIGGDDVVIPAVGTGVQLEGLLITKIFATDTAASDFVGLR